MPVARSTASGNLAGWAVASATIGHAVVARAADGPAAMPMALWGSISSPVWRCRPAMVGQRLLVVDAVGRRTAPRAAASASSPSGELAVAAEAGHRLGERRAVAAVEIEQQPLEIAGDLDVHARGSASAALSAIFMRAGGEEAGEDVVAVGADDQPLDRQAHRRARHSRHRHCRNCRSARRRTTARSGAPSATAAAT